MEASVKARIEQIEKRLAGYDAYYPSDADLWPDALKQSIEAVRFLLSLVKSQEAQPHLTEQDKTRFLDRGFAVVENAGHSLRLIDRKDARHAISIKWEDLSAFRELITLALDDGPMVIGLDLSGQAARIAATSMRSACVNAVKAKQEQWRTEAAKFLQIPSSHSIKERVLAADDIITALESVSIQEQEK